MSKYLLSKDYNKLFEHICNGLEVPCYVDYSFGFPDKVIHAFRDLCLCKRKRPWQISFSVRGVGYGGIDTFEDEGHGNEETLFIERCQALNVEWFVPTQEDALSTSFKAWWEKNGINAGQCISESEAEGIWNAAQSANNGELDRRVNQMNVCNISNQSCSHYGGLAKCVLPSKEKCNDRSVYYQLKKEYMKSIARKAWGLPDNSSPYEKYQTMQSNFQEQANRIYQDINISNNIEFQECMLSLFESKTFIEFIFTTKDWAKLKNLLDEQKYTITIYTLEPSDESKFPDALGVIYKENVPVQFFSHLLFGR
jgi:hypothetical protein